MEHYLLAEYHHIADAHFKTMDSISTFFKHYLVIVSIPISATVLLLSGQYADPGLTGLLTRFRSVVALLLIVISFAGLGVLVYVLNLRFDALLYARTINGIRKHFYDTSGLATQTVSRMRGLPQSPQLPSYFETWYFLPVVGVFALLNGVLACLAWAVWGLAGTTLVWLSALTVAGSIGSHVLAYHVYARHREHQYLRSNIIGVDIDGVLNRHREQFCEFLEANVGKRILPERITRIPVHECATLGVVVSRQDERQVFNDPRYWTTMPVAQDASETLQHIRNAFNMQVHIFTSRPWPMTVGLEMSEADRLRMLWVAAAARFGSHEGHSSMLRSTGDPMKEITKVWLKKHGFDWARLNIEKGGDEISEPRAAVKNRFYMSRKKRIRFFVEDDARKAEKLAYVCDAVFLVEQPYNRDIVNLPANVIRVQSWDEIYRCVRSLS